MGTELADIVLALLVDSPQSFDTLFTSIEHGMTRAKFVEFLGNIQGIQENDGLWKLVPGTYVVISIEAG